MQSGTNGPASAGPFVLLRVHQATAPTADGLSMSFSRPTPSLRLKAMLFNVRFCLPRSSNARSISVWCSRRGSWGSLFRHSHLFSIMYARRYVASLNNSRSNARLTMAASETPDLRLSARSRVQSNDRGHSAVKGRDGRMNGPANALASFPSLGQGIAIHE